MKQCLLSLIFILSLSSCGEHDGTASSSITEGIAAITTAISGFADDQANESYSYIQIKKSPFLELLDQFKLQEAVAASCTRTVNQSCSSSKRSLDLSGCSYSSSITATGTIALEYSDASCTILNTSDTVTRTFDGVQLKGVSNYTLYITSGNITNYSGASHSGGVRLTNNGDNTYNLVFLGLHKILQNGNGGTIYSHSIKSNSNSVISNTVTAGSLARNGRKLTGGQIDIYHNKSKFTSSFTPVDLEWTSSCCHPTSGYWNITFTGSRTGTATLNYSSTCGEATFTQDGENTEITLNYCE
jgi:hypothetical protein